MPTDSLRAVLSQTERLVDEGRLPIAVFDLDSTLFNTAGRHLKILQDFADEVPELAPIVAEIDHHEFGWSVAGPLRSRGIDDPVILAQLSRFWFERFFTDDYVLHDRPSLGGPDFVNAFWERGGLVYYLTGRDVIGMAQGTTKALIAANYPYYRGRTVLHLKPTFEEPDKPFKDEAIAEIRSYRGDVVATFENEPGNANMFLSAFPQASHFLHGLVCAPDGEAGDPSLIRITDFRY